MSKDSCRFHTGNTQWSMWVCLLTWDCLSHYSFHNMAYKKMFNLVKLGVELKMNWLNGSIPISSGFQFQFNSNSKSLNSNPIQFMLNWIELIINSNSIHELIRALHNSVYFIVRFTLSDERTWATWQENSIGADSESLLVAQPSHIWWYYKNYTQDINYALCAIGPSC